MMLSCPPEAVAAGRDPPGTLHVEPHDGFTRLVIVCSGPTGASFHRDGTVVTLTLSASDTITADKNFDLAALPDLRAAEFGPGTVTLSLAPRVAVRNSHAGNLRYIDLFDPPGMAATAPATRVAALPQAIPPRRVSVPAPEAAPIVVDAAVVAAPDMPVANALVAAPARPVREKLAVEPADDAAEALELPFAASTGAAAFNRGSMGIAVFDEARAIDLAALRARAGFASAEVQQLPQATVLRLALPPGTTLAISRADNAWRIAFAPAAAAADGAMASRIDGGRLLLAAPAGGHVVTVPDPVSGDNLLVATASAPGPHIGAARQFAEFAILPTVLGAAVDPLSDRVALRRDAGGLVIESSKPGVTLSISPAAAQTSNSQEQARLSRSFDLPDAPAPALLRRLHAQTSDAAATPVLGRLAYRRSVAQSMLALGLGAEAEAVLQMAADDDPRGLADPQLQALAAAAALIAGRLGETSALGLEQPGETDEHRLWRALRDQARLPDNGTPDRDAVVAVATAIPLLVGYPPTLQRSLLPLAADALLRGGDLANADRLLAVFGGEPSLALARAASLQAHGQDDAALAAYDALAGRPDRSTRARAAVAALDLRMARGRIKPAAAAAAADKLIYAWRGDARERDLRLRIADWQGQAGQYRQQMESLRDALDVFADPADGVRPRLAAAFAAMLAPLAANHAAVPPLELVTLAEENADLMPQGAAGEAIASRLAEALAGLDLPQRAAAVLSKLAHDTASPAARAAFGARLAALQLGEGAAKAALDALASSAPGPPSDPGIDPAAAPELSGSLLEQRAVLAARASAAMGDRPAALAMVAAPAGPAELLTRAGLHEDGHDWVLAAADLASYAAQTLPASGALDSTQSGLVLRLASATAQAKDDAALAKLNTQFGGRLRDPNDQALFALLTERPVRTEADLPRAAAEIIAARALPAVLRAAAHAD